MSDVIAEYGLGHSRLFIEKPVTATETPIPRPRANVLIEMRPVECYCVIFIIIPD